MPKAEIPDGVERYERFEDNFGGYMKPMQFGSYVLITDLPALHAHWLEQLRRSCEAK